MSVRDEWQVFFWWWAEALTGFCVKRDIWILWLKCRHCSQSKIWLQTSIFVVPDSAPTNYLLCFVYWTWDGRKNAISSLMGISQDLCKKRLIHDASRLMVAAFCVKEAHPESSLLQFGWISVWKSHLSFIVISAIGHRAAGFWLKDDRCETISHSDFTGSVWKRLTFNTSPSIPTMIVYIFNSRRQNRCRQSCSTRHWTLGGFCSKRASTWTQRRRQRASTCSKL